MDDILRDFFFWLLKFLAVSIGILSAARVWSVRRRRRQLSVDSASGSNDERSPARRMRLAAAEMAFVLSLCGCLAVGLWLLFRGPASWSDGRVAGMIGITLVAVTGLVAKRLGQTRLDLQDLRHFADLAELAAVRVGEERSFRSACESVIKQQLQRDPQSGFLKSLNSAGGLEAACRKIAPGLDEKFQTLCQGETPTTRQVRDFASEVHKFLEAGSLQQTRRVSAWAKYPLLASAVPILCWMLIAPLTEWALNSFTQETAPKTIQNGPGKVSPQ